MLDPPLAVRIAEAVKEVCLRHGVPLSVKFRLGWDTRTAAEFACAMARAGVDRITLHCRTREQMYRPFADPEAAGEVFRALVQFDPTVRPARPARPTLVGNGDVDSPEAARRYLENGCDEVAVGRAALGDPWIFGKLKDPDGFVPPAWDEIRAAVVRLTEDTVREKGELRGIRESRGRAAYFVRGMRGAAALRDGLNRAETMREFLALLNAFGGEKDRTGAERAENGMTAQGEQEERI
jgi:tRNA-dihydrouridine synthase